jgi:large subunit ribosomal protein L24
MSIRKGDTVLVLAGKDRGKSGKVDHVTKTRRGPAVVVQGINMAKRHQRSRGGRTGSQTAGIIDLPMPIQVSNVMVVCPNCNKPTRIGHARLDDQHKTRVRVCRHCGEQLEVGP